MDYNFIYIIIGVVIYQVIVHYIRKFKRDEYIKSLNNELLSVCSEQTEVLSILNDIPMENIIEIIGFKARYMDLKNKENELNERLKNV